MGWKWRRRRRTVRCLASPSAARAARASLPSVEHVCLKFSQVNEIGGQEKKQPRGEGLRDGVPSASCCAAAGDGRTHQPHRTRLGRVHVVICSRGWRGVRGGGGGADGSQGSEPQLRSLRRARRPRWPCLPACQLEQGRLRTTVQSSPGSTYGSSSGSSCGSPYSCRTAEERRRGGVGTRRTRSGPQQDVQLSGGSSTSHPHQLEARSLLVLSRARGGRPQRDPAARGRLDGELCTQTEDDWMDAHAQSWAAGDAARGQGNGGGRQPQAAPGGRPRAFQGAQLWQVQLDDVGALGRGGGEIA